MPIALTNKKQRVMDYYDSIADKRDYYIDKNKYYYDDLIKFLKFTIPAGKRVLEIGSGTGHILAALEPSYGVGVDLSAKMVQTARLKYPYLNFFKMDAEELELNEAPFEYIVISDTIGLFEDIQRVFKQMKPLINNHTRVVITYNCPLWHPLLNIAEALGLKMPKQRLNWLDAEDVSQLLYLEDFEVIKTGRRFLFPKNWAFISAFINKFIAHLPFFNSLCLTGYIIAKPAFRVDGTKPEPTVSVIIPARNERGNIENAVKRTPTLGSHTEIIFVEGHSNDGTLDEIKRVCALYGNKVDLKYTTQDGKGKGDAVRKGFAMATGDILMILDADLTVAPEELPKFYEAIATGKGEFINGTRLVYPLEKESMRFLNMLGNKFFSIMFTWILGQRLKDTLCGTKVLSRENYLKIQANRYFFGDFDPFGDYDLIFGSVKLNLKIVEVPITYKAREYGETNISRFSHGWLLLKMTMFAVNKLKFR
ncbi:MAG: bifunctional class I SAM-dependent methyltransferase/glycosyltransferase family 2 protein [Nitrospirae bacterium YQR-1]